MKLALVFAATAALPLCAQPAPSEAKWKVITPEAVVSLRAVTDPQISPNAAQVVYQIARPRKNGEKPGAAIREIWMVPAAGGEPSRLTYNETGDRSPQFSPDGKTLAFLSQRGADTAAQIYLLPMAGGEAAPLTRAETAVTSFQWSPDGKRIAYIAADARTKEETENEKHGKDWVIADTNWKHNRLYVIEAATRESRRLSEKLLTVDSFAWAPDSKRLVVAMADTPSVDDAFMKLRLMTVSLDDPEPKLVAKTEGKLTHPCWSPDGKWIAWLGATAFKDPYAGSVFVAPAGGGAPDNLTPGYEGTAVWLGWRPGAPSTLVFTATERQSSAIHQFVLPDRKRQRLLNQALVVNSAPTFSEDGARMALAASTPRHPNEVFLGPVGGALERLTRTNPRLDGAALGEQSEVKWPSVGGWVIEGVLVKPVGYEKGKRYPLVVQPHGGPESADRNGWLATSGFWGQMLAGHGFAVLYPNYRGSIGRGVEFAMADQRDLMGKEFEDMLAGIDYLVKEGIADPKRVGIGGGSYGGYTSAWAATYGSERFQAAVAWMGISNWFSMTGVSDIFLENSTTHWNLIMYENYDLYWKRSPIAHIPKARTPTLIVHGAADPRVPIGQSQELYTGLKWKGVPVEFVTYPREGHGVLETAHQLDFLSRVLGWFEKYLKP